MLGQQRTECFCIQQAVEQFPVIFDVILCLFVMSCAGSNISGFTYLHPDLQGRFPPDAKAW